MFLSLFDIFKIGVGPSSSHTMGPMTAAGRFLDTLREGRDRVPGAGAPARLSCRLYGSLAFTGTGHATDRAVALGLAGQNPRDVDPDEAERILERLAEEKRVEPEGLPPLVFDPAADIVFDYGPALPGHANGMKLFAHDDADALALEETYYSVGGGFVLTERELARRDEAETAEDVEHPHPFANAAEMLEMAASTGASIAALQRANELVALDPVALNRRIDGVGAAMNACIDRGLAKEGVLPGGLGVKRRAKAIHEQLLAEKGLNIAQPHIANDWLSVYAMAVNEENAAGGKVVTSPTNGAAGVAPAVLRYYRDHCHGATAEGERTFLLTAAAIGGIIKRNASISGAEVGCQGEVGSASAMAAAGLCAALGGTPAQVENAAEIALEHHLGMTCDPVGGLVQVPCIERNGLGAIKAVSAASLALRGDGTHFMPLDNCVEAMRQTGRDMSEKYKETSQGGLAVNLPEC
ncbi:MAG: L-serine ammonia-lyase [Pseudomonadota bacterium]